MRFADLHLHTTFSDGTFSPSELVKQAKEVNLSAIAVVDHDTIFGIEPSCQAGREQGVEVLPGIELTVENHGREIHLLGYLIDYQNQRLKEQLIILNKNRIERIHKITLKLKKLGLDLEPEAVFKISQKGSPGRLHIARAMAAEGLVSSIYEAFHKYIGDKGPAYVAGFRLSPQEGINLIKAAGGIPVLAHPYTLGDDEMIPRLVDLGLMGLEFYYSEHAPAMTSHYLKLAKKFQLLLTGGSDFHGAAKPNTKLGVVKIPYELVEKLKEAKFKNTKS